MSLGIIIWRRTGVWTRIMSLLLVIPPPVVATSGAPIPAPRLSLAGAQPRRELSPLWPGLRGRAAGLCGLGSRRPATRGAQALSFWAEWGRRGPAQSLKAFVPYATASGSFAGAPRAFSGRVMPARACTSPQRDRHPSGSSLGSRLVLAACIPGWRRPLCSPRLASRVVGKCLSFPLPPPATAPCSSGAARKLRGCSLFPACRLPRTQSPGGETFPARGRAVWPWPGDPLLTPGGGAAVLVPAAGSVSVPVMLVMAATGPRGSGLLLPISLSQTSLDSHRAASHPGTSPWGWKSHPPAVTAASWRFAKPSLCLRVNPSYLVRAVVCIFSPWCLNFISSGQAGAGG
ncbi:unnamed protein product [Caretta caretta]